MDFDRELASALQKYLHKHCAARDFRKHPLVCPFCAQGMNMLKACSGYDLREEKRLDQQPCKKAGSFDTEKGFVQHIQKVGCADLEAYDGDDSSSAYLHGMLRAVMDGGREPEPKKPRLEQAAFTGGTVSMPVMLVLEVKEGAIGFDSKNRIRERFRVWDADLYFPAFGHHGYEHKTVLLFLPNQTRPPGKTFYTAEVRGGRRTDWRARRPLPPRPHPLRAHHQPQSMHLSPALRGLAPPPSFLSLALLPESSTSDIAGTIFSVQHLPTCICMCMCRFHRCSMTGDKISEIAHAPRPTSSLTSTAVPPVLTLPPTPSDADARAERARDGRDAHPLGHPKRLDLVAPEASQPLGEQAGQAGRCTVPLRYLCRVTQNDWTSWHQKPASHWANRLVKQVGAQFPSGICLGSPKTTGPRGTRSQPATGRTGWSSRFGTQFPSCICGRSLHNPPPVSV